MHPARDEAPDARGTIHARAREYGVALALTGLALLAHVQFDGRASLTFPLLLLGVLLSGSYGGLGPGLASAAIAAGGLVRLEGVTGARDLLPLAVFTAVAIVSAMAAGALRANYRRAVLRRDVVERKAQKLAEAQAFTEHLATAHEPVDVDRAVLEIGLPALGAVGAIVVRATRGGLEVTDVLGYPPDVMLLGATIPFDGRSPLAEAVRTREALWLDSDAEVRQRFPAFAAAISIAGHGALAAIPIVVGEACTGAIALTFPSDRRFAAEERSSILSLVTTAGRVFERARLLEGIARERARAELLASMAADLNRGTEPDEVIRTALSSAARLLGGDDGALFLFDGDRKYLRGIAEVRPEQRTGTIVPIDQLPSTKRALDAGRARFFARTTVGGGDAEWFDRYELTGSIVAPLLEGDRRLGVLYVNYLGLDAPHPDELVFADAIAAQCALAISRARAFETERAERARAAAAEEEARQTALIQERLMAVVGHDLRTPLSAIAMGAQLMARRGGLSPDQARRLARIQHSAERSTHIIRDLLDYSRSRRGLALPIYKHPIRIAEVCERAVLELREVHRDAELWVRDDGDTALEADAARVSQVVSNLVGNAIQHGGRAPVHVTARGAPDEVVIEVHNEGPPIPPAALPTIFEPFQRDAADAEGARAGSVGLGLFIVREIVKAHGGRVEVRSRAEQGTTFSVHLPRAGRAGREGGALALEDAAARAG
jgi:signal transduction histidine kinase